MTEPPLHSGRDFSYEWEGHVAQLEQRAADLETRLATLESTASGLPVASSGSTTAQLADPATGRTVPNVVVFPASPASPAAVAVARAGDTAVRVILNDKGLEFTDGTGSHTGRLEFQGDYSGLGPYVISDRLYSDWVRCNTVFTGRLQLTNSNGLRWELVVSDTGTLQAIPWS